MGARDLIETLRHLVAGDDELATNDQRILLVVALSDGGCVLVPVGKGGIVKLEHQHETFVEQSEHISHVTAIFARGPHVWARTNRRTW